MSSTLAIRYFISVEGIEAATTSLNNAQTTARQASAAMNDVKATSEQVSRVVEEAGKSQTQLQDVSRATLSVGITLIREVNAARLAIVQAHRAITEMDPVAALYAFLNIVQVANTLIPLMKSLQAVSQGTAVAHGIIATLSGMGWMVPVAIAAGAAIMAAITIASRSKQMGGYIEETGVYLLHKGEYVVPASQITNYGPFYVTFSGGARGGFSKDDFIREYGAEISRRARRMGL